MQHSPDTKTSAGTKADWRVGEHRWNVPRLSTFNPRLRSRPDSRPGLLDRRTGLAVSTAATAALASCPLCRNERVVHNEELRTSGYVHFVNFSRKQSGISMGPFG